MSRLKSRDRLLLAALIPLALVAAAVGTAKVANPPVKKKARPTPTAGGNLGVVKATWKEVDRLVDEQKMEEASKLVEKIRLEAKAKGDEAEWTRALIREVQLRTALHGYETSVRYLMDQPWPKGPRAQATLRLFYAASLVTYERAYGWEIGKREKVESKEKVDLKAWTKEQIFAEAVRAYVAVWNERAALDREPVTVLSEYVDANSYPKGIRDTLRDAVSYLFVELLADTTGWRPEQSNEVFSLDLPSLIAGDTKVSSHVKLDDPAVHPLVKIGAILDDLEAWHAGAGEREAALEARLARLRRLYASFTEAEDKKEIRKALERRLPAFRDVAWWAAGMADLASFVRNEDDPHALVRARKLAEEGRKAYPDSIGGQRCLHIVKSIEAPDYSLSAMSSDGARKRSIEVTHRNLPALTFRAFPVDLVARVESARDYNLLPASDELRKILRNQKPAAEWKVDLPATPDFKSHRTFVTPPLDAPSLYVVIASAKADFSTGENRILGTNVLVSNLVLVVRPNEPSGAVEGIVLSGDTGKPVSGAKVFLYRYDWQRGHDKIETKTAGADGLVRFEFSDEKQSHSHFLLAKNGQDLALDPNYIGFYRYQTPPETTSSLVYTDRSIYRPLQKLYYKVVAYHGKPDTSRYEVLPQNPVTVTLYDPNNQKVDAATLTTNAYGSAAGEFTIPTGRVLGVWRLDSSLTGQASIRVEEYKRPTFEAKLLDPKEPLRLNRKAALRGEARYYFGLPVVNGTVRWRVTREPVYPWWWGWSFYGGRSASSDVQTIATGTSPLKEDGTFDLSFTAAADERRAKGSRDVTYRYHVAADVTDEGGETRSAERSFRLGFVSVEARVDPEQGFTREGDAVSLSIVRSDLDGIPRSGKGTYQVVRVSEPEKALLPSELPVSMPFPGGTKAPAEDEGLKTPGDLLRPRWAGAEAWERVVFSWPDGAKEKSGTLSHDEKGVAKAEVGGLSPGVYRFKYETVDDFGATFKISKDFVVGGKKTSLPLGALLLAEKRSVKVGETARFLVLSGLPNQLLFADVYRAGKLAERRRLDSSRDATLLEIPVGNEDRGGVAVSLSALRDHQFLQQSDSVYVPWEDRELKVEFATFRDTFRPGAKETWRVTVKGGDGKKLESGSAELLAYMYDRSLDLFAPHTPPAVLSLYPARTGTSWLRPSLGQSGGQWIDSTDFPSIPGYPYLSEDRLKFYDGYGIGGPGRRGYVMKARAMNGGVAGGVLGGVEGGVPAPAAPGAQAMSETVAMDRMAPKPALKKEADEERKNLRADTGAAEPPAPPVTLRSDFSETAFWKPQLLTDKDGTVAFEFTAPDSVTSWNVWIHALTKDLRGGSLHEEARSVKELMVRPYLPRFLREGDEAELRVVVNNAGKTPLKGDVVLEILDPDTNKSLLSDFGLDARQARLPFDVKEGGGGNVRFRLATPRRVGLVAFKVTAVAGDTSDGELRPLPLLPSRVHLVQSRFVTLRNKDRKVMRFEDLERNDDKTRIDEQMVVTVDAQLFYTVLQSLPYLVNYPYECTEQTLNRFVSTGIVSSVFNRYPAVARMAQEMSKRDVPLETFDAADPNRKMALEETPWLETAKGGKDAGYGLSKVLDPRIAKADRDSALAKLRKAQTANGGFPWWPGGPPSPYMTLYILHGFAKALEFGVDVPKDMVVRAWPYMASHYRETWRDCMAHDGCWEFLTFLNYVASCYPDDSWTAGGLTAAEKKEILDFTFRHWKQHSPYLKGYLALTLKRAGRTKDAHLVWDSVMDSAKTNEEQGTFWAPEDRSWLWYNDTIETHAFALRTLMELDPKDTRKDGLVQWLLLNKKLNQWKSTRATAEVIYSLVEYLQGEGALGIAEDATVTIGTQKVTFTFPADTYTGKKNQIVVPGEKVDPKTTSTVVVEKESKGFAFASTTWHFSTEELPKEDRGDFFNVSRRYFRREHDGREWKLTPLAEGAVIKPGDEVEVQISLRSKHEAEYVHLRDPRAAGLEPENPVSKFKWELGIGWYEETRDSGSNFFFEYLPVGEYTFKYRLRANMSGTFRIGPATVQSMYAPEFNAYSSGYVMTIAEEKGQ